MRALRRLPQAGYTLIELLLYIVIVSTLLSALTTFFLLNAESRVKNQSINEVNQQGTYAMDMITQTTRNALSITSPTATNSSASYVMTVPTGSLSPTTFALNGTIMTMQEASAAAVPLTNSKVQITNFTVTNLTRSGTYGVVRISFTMTRTNTAGRNEYDYTKTFVSTAAMRL